MTLRIQFKLMIIRIIIGTAIMIIVFFSDQSGEQSGETSNLLILPKTNGLQRSASVPAQPFTNKVRKY